MASRSEPGPLSALEVTVNVAARAEKVKINRNRVRANFMEKFKISKKM